MRRRNWYGMGMIDGLAYVLCMDKGVLLPRSSALG